LPIGKRTRRAPRSTSKRSTSAPSPTRRARRKRSLRCSSAQRRCYSEKILTTYPNVRCTIVDLPAAVAYCKKRLEGFTHRARLDVIEGDALALAVESQFDLVFISDLLHYFSDAQKEEALVRAFRALKSGGTLVVSKFRLEANGIEPKFASHFALKKFLDSPTGGYLETNEETLALMTRLGQNARIVPLNDTKTLVVAEKA
jgi:SAM-dependent methyltransferase